MVPRSARRTVPVTDVAKAPVDLRPVARQPVTAGAGTTAPSARPSRTDTRWVAGLLRCGCQFCSARNPSRGNLALVTNRGIVPKLAGGFEAAAGARVRIVTAYPPSAISRAQSQNCRYIKTFAELRDRPRMLSKCDNGTVCRLLSSGVPPRRDIPISMPSPAADHGIQPLSSWQGRGNQVSTATCGLGVKSIAPPFVAESLPAGYLQPEPDSSPRRHGRGDQPCQKIPLLPVTARLRPAPLCSRASP